MWEIIYDVSHIVVMIFGMGGVIVLGTITLMNVETWISDREERKLEREPLAHLDANLKIMLDQKHLHYESGSLFYMIANKEDYFVVIAQSTPTDQDLLHIPKSKCRLFRTGAYENS